MAAKKLDIENEINPIQNDIQILKVCLIQELTKRMKEYESEIQQLDHMNGVEIDAKKLVSVLHQDFSNKLEEYKQVKENIRKVYEKQAELSRTQEPDEKMTSDTSALQPITKSSVVD